MVADINKLVANLREAKHGPLIISMFLGYTAYLFRALRWLLILNHLDYKTSLSNATHAVAIGYFANALFPRAGEIVRCTSLYKVTEIPVSKLFGTVLLERSVDFGLLVLGITLSFFLKLNEISFFFNSVLNDNNGDQISNTALIFGCCCVLISSGLYFFRNNLRKSRLFQKVISLGQGVKEGFQAAFLMKQKGLFLFYSILIWLMYLLMTYVCFFSIPETAGLTFVDGLYIMVVGGLGMIVPVQGGIGSYHAAVTLGVASIGLSETTGITLAVLIHAAQSIMIIIAGFFSAIFLSFAKRRTQ